MTASSTSATASTAYAYDLADRLSSITQAGGSVIGFTFDAAGRHATRTAGSGGDQTTIDVYSYLAATDSVTKDVDTSGAATPSPARSTRPAMDWPATAVAASPG